MQQYTDATTLARTFASALIEQQRQQMATLCHDFVDAQTRPLVEMIRAQFAPAVARAESHEAVVGPVDQHCRACGNMLGVVTTRYFVSRHKKRQYRFRREDACDVTCERCGHMSTFPR